MKADCFDTENSSENLIYTADYGSPAIIAFTGMARGLNELSNFEFMRTVNDFSFTKIFVRDPYYAFYHKGIDNNTYSIPLLAAKLNSVLLECGVSRFTCVGVSAGGFAALLFGHLLCADYAHAFGPQTILYKSWGEDNDDQTIRTCDALHSLDLTSGTDFRDLEKILSRTNGKTIYTIHNSSTNEQDLKHAQNIQGCPNVRVISYDCSGHACASHELKREGRLGSVIVEGLC